MKEEQVGNNKPSVANETVMMSGTIVSNNLTAPGEPASKSTQKANRGMLVSIIILAIIAIGGIAFGIWAMFSQNDKIASLETDLANCAAANNNADNDTENVTVACPDGTETEIIKNVITNDLAQNLIKPYIVSQGYLVNVFDLGLNDDTRFYIAYNNTEDSATSINNGVEMLYYTTINRTYTYLFGSNNDLEKRDYNNNCSANYTYDYSTNRFEIAPKGCGGTGRAMFDIVKDARYENNNIIIDVYHNVVSICFPDVSDENCMDIGVSSAIIDSIDQYNMRDYIQRFADSIPVYTMIFVKDDGHYVLSDIQKQ